MYLNWSDKKSKNKGGGGGAGYVAKEKIFFFVNFYEIILF